MELSIVHQSLSPFERLPISYRIREYLNTLITKNIIHPVKLRNNLNFRVVLFFEEETQSKNYEIIPGRQISNLKMTTVLVPLSLFNQSEDVTLRYCKLVLEVVGIILSSEFKKIDKNNVEQLVSNIDFDFLNSFKYPALFSDQKYEGDDNEEIRTITN